MNRGRKAVLWLVFCGPDQANTGNEENQADDTKDDQRFNITVTSGGADKKYRCINKTCYSKDG